jgi:mannose-6-phosphate isomerase-like protein (cupin superfamily)
MTDHAQPVVSKPGEGEHILAFGDNLIRIAASQTSGQLGVIDVTVPPGDGTPPHIHAREEEFFRVLEGRVDFWCGNDHIVLEEGGCILLPRDVPHRFANQGDTPARLMVMVLPGGFEGFFSTAASRKPTSPGDIQALADAFGLSFLP